MTTMTISAFVDLAVQSESGLRLASKDMAELIETGGETAMQQIFGEFRGRFADAKVSNAKTAMRDISAAWRNASNGMRYWLTKANLSASWPQIRTGEGECVLKTSKDAAKDAKAKAAAQKERDAADARTAADAKAADALAALRSLSAEELASQIVETITASGLDMRDVLGHVAKANGLTIRKVANKATKKAA